MPPPLDLVSLGHMGWLSCCHLAPLSQEHTYLGEGGESVQVG
jgi:hypothetical protein